MAIMNRVGLVSPEAYERVALNDPEGNWELFDGSLQEKPGMWRAHNYVAFELSFVLRGALDPTVYEVRSNAGRLRVSAERYYIPDVIVIPRSLTVGLAGRSDALDLYADPLPFVAEVWSPSTGPYDVKAKLRGYQERGDAEIWYIQPFDKTITIWRRQPDGSYLETSPAIGPIEIVSLPGVTVDLAALLDKA
ncbi:MAG: Uma2 family endonuclease [Chloroflexia bacterium]|nr:Uma2 family endonuclease [Chloroflexia bacterium]